MTLFFSIRMLLALVAALSDLKLYEAALETFGPHCARFLLPFLLFNAGSFEASTALVPSAYAACTTTAAWSCALLPLTPSSSSGDDVVPALMRAFAAVFLFALGALLGWPFALVLSLPFVLEHLFLARWLTREQQRDAPHRRLAQFLRLAAVSGIAIGLPALIIDTLAYGRTSFVAWNIVSYNILSKARGAGPELYGTEPATYYLRALLLTFNFGLPLALLSAPVTLAAHLLGPKQRKSDPHALLPKQKLVLTLVRLSPAYLWLALLSTQPHKEERFLYPAYALLCLNAAVCLAQLRHIGLHHLPLPPRLPASTTRTARSAIKCACWALVGAISLLGAARSAALTRNFSASLAITRSLWGDAQLRAMMARRGLVSAAAAQPGSRNKALLASVATLHDPITVCYGGEWYRFASSFQLPAGVQAEFTHSSYTGILPATSPAAAAAGLHSLPPHRRRRTSSHAAWCRRSTALGPTRARASPSRTTTSSTRWSPPTSSPS